MSRIKLISFYVGLMALTGFYLAYTNVLYSHARGTATESSTGNTHHISARRTDIQVSSGTRGSQENSASITHDADKNNSRPNPTGSNENKKDNKGKTDRKHFPETVLPSKVFTIIGLESSGTTFVSETIRNALGLQLIGNKGYYESLGEGFSDHYYSESESHNEKENTGTSSSQEEATKLLRWTEVQHISLPWGGTNCRNDPRDSVVPVIYPAICTKLMRDRMRAIHQGGNLAANALKGGPFVPNYHSESLLRTYRLPMNSTGFQFFEECRNITQDQWEYPQRYSLNVTSHLDWYLSQGIDARVVVIMRDATISRRARQEHCTDLDILAQEEELGREILQDAIRRYIVPSSTSKSDDEQRYRRHLLETSEDGRVVLVSYELLNQLKGDYIKMMYHKLGIQSAFEPRWADGNIKHVSEGPPPKKGKELSNQSPVQVSLRKIPAQ